ncbi:MAG TPA: NlpC/P60 family protein [Spirochaetota bacterium]|nr:NlpC/P60 family protein [Spirochaetota bacterium]
MFKFKKIKKILFFILLFILSVNSVPDKSEVHQIKQIRNRIIKQARTFLGRRRGRLRVRKRSFRFDCSGLVMACYYSAGIKLARAIKPDTRSASITTALYDSFQHKKWRSFDKRKPRPGDLVFFANTYDRNRNRKWDDGITHVALVEKVTAADTVYIIHRTSRGVVRDVMNFKYKNKYKHNGSKINDYLRKRSPHSGKPGSAFFAVNLLAGFVDVLTE